MKRLLTMALGRLPWIPAAEDEPPLGTTVLFSVWDPDARRMKVSAGWRGRHYYWLDKDTNPVDPARNIVHWMPLPEEVQP